MPKKLVALRLDMEQIEGLERLKSRTGAPIAELVRRAIASWLAAQGVKLAAGDSRKGVRRSR